MNKQHQVKAWVETIIIPTYEVSQPEKYPVFLEKRVYQGSSGAVYPNPVIEKISNEKIDKPWEVVFLENKYLKIMVLPALGGRIQMAYDKIKQRHFVYYNEVIKPALVGLTGPWISGGIEFNWPQHHRPSTYDPVDFSIEENVDGSITVWVSEVERMSRTKGMAGFTLHPDKAYLEIKGKIYNPTPHPQTFLWWANPAVAVNDHYQSVFPEDVNAVYDHGKRDVSTFPIATGTYYKVDYSKGVDISKYKNIPVPTSYMAVNSEYNFVGGYEHDIEAGLLHIADHHISPGKKQWTWGNGDFGHAWESNLSDENGPYIELMCGVYTDNQPDFSWLQPYEEKNFTQYFMPYQKVGMVKNASKDAVLNVKVEGNEILFSLYVTGEFNNCTVRIKIGENEVYNKSIDIDPYTPFFSRIPFNGKKDLLLAQVFDNDGKVLVAYQQKKEQLKPVPEPAKPAKAPQDIQDIEELYLTGLHLEQYRHATYFPGDYYLEGLKRNPSDIRCNNAMGLLMLRSAKFDMAAGFFKEAINSLTRYNPNPYDGEGYFNLGVTLKFLGNYNEAYDAFYKSAWNAAWQDAAFFNLASIDLIEGRIETALEMVEKSLVRNWNNHKARHLKVIILRKNKKEVAADSLIKESLEIDNFNFGILFEKWLIHGEERDRDYLIKLIRDNVHNYLEYAIDYGNAGQYHEALALLNLYFGAKSEGYPMAYYFAGYYHFKLGELEKASEWMKKASRMSPDYCFPNRLEEVIVLLSAIEINPRDSKALYYLGNFWMSRKQFDDARICWEKSKEIDSNFSIVLRNLALVYYNKFNKKQEAVTLIERAFLIDSSSSRILMELDQLYKKIKKAPKERLTNLQNHFTLVEQRDDLYLEYITLLNLEKRYEEALRLLKIRQFHPWEGGEGKVPEQFVLANVELAKECLGKGQYNKALQFLDDAQHYPGNLGEGKLVGTQENDIFFYTGCVYHALGEKETARGFWVKASEGLREPSLAMYYNDQSPDTIFYQGLALMELGDIDKAHARFQSLIEYGEKHLYEKVKIEYFAVSLPDLLIWDEDLMLRNTIHCQYLIGLGELGFAKFKSAKESFEKGLSLDPANVGLNIHLEMANNSLLSINVQK